MPPSSSSSSASARGVSKTLLTSALLIILIAQQPTFTNAGILDGGVDEIRLPSPVLLPTPPPADTENTTTGPQGPKIVPTLAPGATAVFDSTTTIAPIAVATLYPRVGGDSSTIRSWESGASGGGGAGGSSSGRGWAGDEGGFGPPEKDEPNPDDDEGKGTGFGDSTYSPTPGPTGSTFGSWSTAPTSSPSGMHTASPSGVSDDFLMTAGPSSMNMDDLMPVDQASGGFSPAKNAITTWNTLPFCVAVAAAVTGIATVFSWVA